MAMQSGALIFKGSKVFYFQDALIEERISGRSYLVANNSDLACPEPSRRCRPALLMPSAYAVCF